MIAYTGGMQTACPQCRNPSFAIYSRTQLRCGKCGHVWQLTLEYPSLPGPVVVPKANFRSTGATGGARAKVVILVGVAMAVLAGGFYVAFATVNDEHMDGDYLPEPGKNPSTRVVDRTTDTTAAKPVVEQPKVLTGELLTSRMQGATKTHRYWVLLLNNPHDRQIEAQRITLKPANGIALDRYSASCGIPANTNMWMLVVLEDSSQQDYKIGIAPVLYASAHNMPKVSRVGLKNLAIDQPPEGTSGRPKVRGSVHNNTAGPVDRVYVQVIGLDEQRNPVAYAETFLSKTIEAGGELGFVVNTGTYQVETPHRWEVQAFGTSKK